MPPFADAGRELTWNFNPTPTIDWTPDVTNQTTTTIPERVYETLRADDVARDTITIDRDVLNTFDQPTNFTFAAPQFTMPTFITKEDLDKFAKRIYQIITEHTKIDISEEEYLKLLKEDEG